MEWHISKVFLALQLNQLHHYSLPTLDENPDVVIIHVGINDLISVYENNKTPENEIADEIIKIGKKCADKGVETVFISSLVFNQRVEWKRIEIINEQLKRNCMNQGFIFYR